MGKKSKVGKGGKKGSKSKSIKGKKASKAKSVKADSIPLPPPPPPEPPEIIPNCTYPCPPPRPPQLTTGPQSQIPRALEGRKQSSQSPRETAGNLGLKTCDVKCPTAPKMKSDILAGVIPTTLWEGEEEEEEEDEGEGEEDVTEEESIINLRFEIESSEELHDSGYELDYQLSESDLELEPSEEISVSPPALIPRTEYLYHVNVTGEEGVLEIDRITECHPLPNCRLREMERQRLNDAYYPQDYVQGTCSDIFFVDPPEACWELGEECCHQKY